MSPNRGVERHYRVLGLKPGADLNDVKAAYRRLAKRWHPDRSSAAPHAIARFHRIAEAYRTIVARKERALVEFAVFLQGVPAHGSLRDLVRKYHTYAISSLLLSRLALTYMEEGEFIEAYDVLNRLAMDSMPLVTSYINLAYLHFLMGSDEQTLVTLYRAKELFGDDFTIVLNLSALLKKAGRFLDAAREIEEYGDEADSRSALFSELAAGVSFFDDKRRVIRHLKRAVDERRSEIVGRNAGRDIVRLLTHRQARSSP